MADKSTADQEIQPYLQQPFPAYIPLLLTLLPTQLHLYYVFYKPNAEMAAVKS